MIPVTHKNNYFQHESRDSFYFKTSLLRLFINKTHFNVKNNNFMRKYTENINITYIKKRKLICHYDIFIENS